MLLLRVEAPDIKVGFALTEVTARTPRSLRGHYVQCPKGRRGKETFTLELRLAASALLAGRQQLVGLYATRVNLGAVLPDVLQILEAYELLPEEAARLSADCPGDADCIDEFDELRRRVSRTTAPSSPSKKQIYVPLSEKFDAESVIRRNQAFIMGTSSPKPAPVRAETVPEHIVPVHGFFEDFPPAMVEQFINGDWSFRTLCKSLWPSDGKKEEEVALNLDYRAAHYFCAKYCPPKPAAAEPAENDLVAVEAPSGQKKRKWNVEGVYMVSWLLNTFETISSQRFLQPGTTRFWQQYGKYEQEEARGRVKTRIIERLFIRLRKVTPGPVASSLEEISTTLRAVSNATRHLCQPDINKDTPDLDAKLDVKENVPDLDAKCVTTTETPAPESRRILASYPGLITLSSGAEHKAATLEPPATEHPPPVKAVAGQSSAQVKQGIAASAGPVDKADPPPRRDIRPIEDTSGLGALSDELLALPHAGDEVAFLAHVLEAMGGLPSDRLYIEHDSTKGRVRLIALR